MSQFKARLCELINQPDVLKRLPEPIQLASGEWSCDFIDGKLAVDDPEDLDFVGAAMHAAALEAGVEFDAVGGLVLGAVPFTFAISQAARCKWFLIRKEPKGRGTNLWVEGARIAAGSRVMLVDDVVTTGGSIKLAYERARLAGAKVVFATALVDRGNEASGFFASVDVPYFPMLTYADIGIEAVHREHKRATAAG
ncbi:MAG: orotate phosphoribosyltransferase [Actinobacteria bacterium]|nr:orotate phosphoribosyltransferase [Actinomycetota bacterium]